MTDSPHAASPDPGPAPRRWTFGDACLDERTLVLTVRGAAVAIERKPLEVLSFLLQHAGEAVTKEEFFETLWPGRVVTEQVLTQCISKLREALGGDGQSPIKTVHGYGYRLVGKIQAEAAVGEPQASSRVLAQPETRFVPVGKDRVAYQVLGDGPCDVLLTPGFWSHLEIPWEDPGPAHFYRRLASFSRLILFDRRGSGLSDHPTDDGRSAVEHWIDDCSAVLHAVGSQAPTIVSLNLESLTLQFLAAHPKSCSGLVIMNGSACWAARPDYPQGHSPGKIASVKAAFAQAWGRPEFAARILPSQAGNAPFLQWYAKFQRAVASPRAVVENLEVSEQIDSRSTLARLQLPVLVMVRTSSRSLFAPSEPSFIEAQSRYIADHVTGARLVELPGTDLLPYWETPDLILGHIEKFVETCRRGAEPSGIVPTTLPRTLCTLVSGGQRRHVEIETLFLDGQPTLVLDWNLTTAGRQPQTTVRLDRRHLHEMDGGADLKYVYAAAIEDPRT
jgi:DNA-binding winged helix-turn-helix (wHTH) protein